MFKSNFVDMEKLLVDDSAGNSSSQAPKKSITKVIKTKIRFSLHCVPKNLQIRIVFSCQQTLNLLAIERNRRKYSRC